MSMKVLTELIIIGACECTDKYDLHVYKILNEYPVEAENMNNSNPKKEPCDGNNKRQVFQRIEINQQYFIYINK